MRMPGPPGRFCPWCAEEDRRRPMRGPMDGPRNCPQHGEKTTEEIMAKYSQIMTEHSQKQQGGSDESKAEEE